MKFTILERMTLFDLLPEMGNFLTLKAIFTVREELSLSDEEREDVGFKNLDGGGLSWNAQKDGGKEIEIPKSLEDIIIKKLKELDDSEQLTSRHVTLFEKFIGE